MSGKRIQSSCRPDSARTQSTKLTLPSDNNLSLTTNSAFKASDRNPFADTEFAESHKPLKPKSQIKKSFIANDEERKEKEKEKERQKLEYEKLKLKPMQKSTISTKDDEKNLKKQPRISKETKPPSNLKTAKQKEQQSKQAATNSISMQPPPFKIDYSKWKVNKPFSKQKQKQTKKQEQETAQQRKRRQFMQMTQFVNEMELKNMDYLSSNYQISIENATRKINNGQLEGLETWNSSLENEFSDFKFNNILKTIEDNEKQLEKIEEVQRQSESQPSIMNMTLSDLQQRNNLFITEINKNKKLKSQSISTLSQIEKTQQRLQDLEKVETEKQQQDQENSSSENDSPNKPVRNPISNVIQRNIISISTPYYECDYLSEQHKKRLAELLEQIQTGVSNTPNPFALSQQLQMHIRLIDEGIRVHRRQKTEQIVIDPKDLPRDPELRKQAELKILRQKLESINQKLLNLNKGSIAKAEINELVAKLKEQCLIPSSKTVEIKKQTLRDLSNRNTSFQEFIETAQSNSASIQSDMRDIKSQFRQLEQEVQKLRNLSVQQQHELELRNLSDFKGQVEEINKLLELLPQEVENMEGYARKIQSKIDKIEEEFGEIEIEKIEVPGYRPDETIKDIQILIQHKINNTGREA